MGLKRFILLSLLFTCSFIFSQSNKHDSWIIKFDQNVYLPLTEQEEIFIISAFGKNFFKRIVETNALEIYYKDILRNRVKVLFKKYHEGESLNKLSSLHNTNRIFDKNNFNPLIYDFDFESKKSQAYRVEDTDYIVIIKPKTLK
tara:strand:+ start:32 stop:463 length:432 start_codon:yes stop_codon:yes gene_type:complete